MYKIRMRVLLFACAGILLYSVPPADSYGSAVEVTEDRKFNLEVNQSQISVVFFYLSYCTTCHNFDKIWRDLVRRFRDNYDVRFLQVNGEKLSVTAKRNNIHLYPTVMIYNKKREDKIMYKGKKEVAPMFATIDDELKYELPKLISIQSQDYTPLVFDLHADVVVLFLTQGCRGCLQAEKDMTEIMIEYHEVIGENKIKFLKNDASVSRVLSRIYDVMDYPSVWFFPRNYKEGIPFKGVFNTTHMKNMIDFYFGYSQRWTSETFGMRGRVPKIEAYLGPTLEDLRKQKLIGTEIQVMGNKIRSLHPGEESKYYVRGVEFFLPRKEGLYDVRRHQVDVADIIQENFAKRHRQYEQNENVISEWNIMQFFRDYQYVPPVDKKKINIRQKDEL